MSDHSSSEISYITPLSYNNIWLQIDSIFLNNYLLTTSTSGILFEFAAENYKPIYKSNDESEDYLPNSQIEINLVLPKENMLNKLSNTIKNKRNYKLKRKLDDIESKVHEYKKKKTTNDVKELRDKLLLLKLDIPTKSFLLDKYESIQSSSGSDYSKGMNWLNTINNIPHGKFKQFNINKDDPQEIKEFFIKAKEKLDSQILGLDDVKQEILEFIARKISNPKSKGHVLALCGPAGVGKSKISKCLADVLDLPFFQINCGGLNDSAVLVGHSETYVGAKPGKIVEILQKSEYMNPIIYLDEIDKLGHKSREINGILTHLLDEEQNNQFQDNYLSNVNLNLSKVFFIISFNDISKVDSIVSDRMKVIYIKPPKLEDKVEILQNKMLPEIIKNINIKEHIEISRETIEYVILNKCTNEEGVRNLKKTFEKILYKFNYDLLVQNESLKLVKMEIFNNNIIYKITRPYIDLVLENINVDNSFLSMYV